MMEKVAYRLEHDIAIVGIFMDLKTHLMLRFVRPPAIFFRPKFAYIEVQIGKGSGSDDAVFRIEGRGDTHALSPVLRFSTLYSASAPIHEFRIRPS